MPYFAFHYPAKPVKYYRADLPKYRLELFTITQIPKLVYFKETARSWC